MKKPYEKNKLKSVPVVIRFTKSEAAALKTAAEAGGVSVSEHARRIIFSDNSMISAMLLQVTSEAE